MSGYDEFWRDVKSDEAVASLDPLGLDSFMANELPKLNNAGKSQDILQHALSISTFSEKFGELSMLEARAIIRDLGMIAASLAKHDSESRVALPLEQCLVQLSLITNEVPRDTVFSYGTRNPQDWRMRTFTATSGEKIFVSGFAKGMALLPLCVYKLLSATQTSIFDSRFQVLLEEATAEIKELAMAMAEVRKNITPKFFTETLRPYFPPLEIRSRTYMAPGGAQMLLLIVDRILWGAGTTNSTYEAYYRDNLQYLPLHYRNLSEQITQSLESRVVAEAENIKARIDHKAKKQVKSALTSVELLLSELIGFRAPHQKTATENFRIRPETAVGSGGYSLEILETLMSETRKSRDRLRAYKFS